MKQIPPQKRLNARLYQGDKTDFTRRELSLKPNYKLQRYEIDYDQFHTAKEWRIFYKAQSMEGSWSQSRVGYVVSEGIEIATKVKTILDKTAYHAGDNVWFDITLYGEEAVDLYIGVIFPQGDYQTIAYPLNFSTANVFQPYKTGIPLSGEQTFHILKLKLPPIASGNYQACALITKVDSDPLNNANWLQLDCKRFQFQ